MAKVKRSYFLPAKLADMLDDECRRGGYVREAVVAAAINHFLGSGPNDRQEMFVNLDPLIDHDTVKKRKNRKKKLSKPTRSA